MYVISLQKYSNPDLFLLPNLIPLVITAGVMGWAGVPLKPSTVLVFSIALGIAIDITIRFLVNYKQDSTVNRTVESMRHSNDSFHRNQYRLYFSGADRRICHFLFQWIWWNTGTRLAYFAYARNGNTYKPDISTSITDCD